MTQPDLIAHGNNVRNCLAGARTILGLRLSGSREVTRNQRSRIYTEDVAIYDVKLRSGHVITCYLDVHARGERCWFVRPGFKAKIRIK
jgi:hypothetical protein